MVKCPGVIGWKANARPPGWQVWKNAPLFPGGGGMGTAGIDWCINGTISKQPQMLIDFFLMVRNKSTEISASHCSVQGYHYGV